MTSLPPEEKVRRAWLRKMIHQLGYPKSLLVVERGLDPGSSRRVDLLCYTPGPDGLSPLLLMECKAIALDSAAQNQLLGYNEAIGAPFMALVNAQEVKTFWREPGRVASIPFLPSYAQLLAKLYSAQSKMVGLG